MAKGLVGTIVYGIAVLFEGVILSIMWGWFVVPTFRAPALSIPVAIGISTMLTLFFYQPEREKKDDEELSFRAIGRAIGFQIVGLAFGWLVHLFM